MQILIRSNDIVYLTWVKSILSHNNIEFIVLDESMASTEGNISANNMYRIFNCGIGMVLIVEEDNSKEISKKISSLNFKNFVIGKVKEKTQNNSVVFL